MSKEKKESFDSNKALPITPGEIFDETFYYLYICPKCSSSIEILLINEINNIIKFRCIKENKEYIMDIKEYIKKIKEKKKRI